MSATLPKWDRVVAIVLDAEGLLSNDPRDPGGPTKYGISWVYHEAELRQMFGIEAIADLTREQAIEFYRVKFWTPVHGDDMPFAVALPLFDAAVMSAPEDATRWLQTALRVTIDGIMGPKTVEAANKTNGLPRVMGEFQAWRVLHLMAQMNWGVYGRGWLARAFRVQMLAGT